MRYIWIVLACVLLAACSPGFSTDVYFVNECAQSLVVSSGKSAGSKSVDIKATATVQMGVKAGTGYCRQSDGAALIQSQFKDSLTITFADGKALRFLPSALPAEEGGHSPYSESSYQFEMIDVRPSSSYARCFYVIMESDYQKAK